jgi:hypothetical protein
MQCSGQRGDSSRSKRVSSHACSGLSPIPRFTTQYANAAKESGLRGTPPRSWRGGQAV